MKSFRIHLFISTFSLLSLFFFLLNPLFAVPTVDLGQDTVACGSLVLDAQNPGATYLWSTNETTQSIIASTSGIYWVEVTDGTGSSRDSIFVNIAQTPALPLISDTSFCGAGTYELSIQNSADFNIAYSAAVNGDILGLGSTLVLDIPETSVFYIEAASSIKTHIGPSEASGASGLYTNGPRGFFFNAYTLLSIDSATVYAQSPTAFLIELKNAGGEVIQSKTLALETEGKHKIGIGFNLLPGEEYSLVGTPLNGSLSYLIPGAQYPYSAAGIMEITRPTHPLNTIALYFFEVIVSSATCPSDRVAVQTSISPNPVVDLGEDRVQCGEITLDVANEGATYLWTNGTTASSITLNESDTVGVSVSLGPCSTSDSVILQIISEPPTPELVSQTICGPENVLFTNQNPADFTIWYDAESGGNTVGIGTSISQKINSSTTLYAEAASYASATVGEQEFPLENRLFARGLRGIIFDVHRPIILEQISVYADIPLRLFVELRDANGVVLKSMNMWIPRGEGKETVVPLGFEIPQGTDYQLLGIPSGNAQLGYIFPNPQYPYEVPDVLTITKSTNPVRPFDLYNTFFKWVIGYPECPSPRLPLSYTVSIPVTLEDSAYTCSDFVFDTGLTGMKHSWSTGSTNTSITVSEPGLYWVEIDNEQGCIVRDSVRLDFPKPLNLGEDGVLCGNTIFSAYDTASSFLWSTNDTTPNLFIDQVGTYSLIVEEPRGCIVADTITISSFDTFPEVNLGEDLVACQSALLDAGNPGLQYSWSHGATTQTVEVTSSGMYTVTVNNENNCSTTDTINVLIIKAPESFFSYSVVGRQVFFNNLSSFGSYLWNFGDGSSSTEINPIHTYLGDGTYEVQLIVANSCTTDTMRAEITIITVDINQANWEGSVNIYPNPAIELLHIDFEASTIAGEVQLRLVDMRGQVLSQQSFYKAKMPYIHRLNVGHLPNGAYLLYLQQDERVFHGKVFLAR